MESVPGRFGSYPLIVTKAVKGDPHIKQPEAAEMEIVPKLAFRFMFSGPSNSGKTNLARWMLDKYYIKAPNKTFFDRIYLFSPTGKLDPVWKDLEGLRPGDRITELDNGGKARLEEIFENALRRTKAMGKDHAPHELVIFDDAIADTRFLNAPYFLKCFVAGRHGNVSCMVMTQSYMKVPRSVRMQITALAMFPSRVTEIKRLWEEHGPIHMPKNDFIDMVKYAIAKTEQEKFPFFFLDTMVPEEKRFRRCLNEVLVPTATNSFGSQDLGSAGLLAGRVKVPGRVRAAREPRSRKRKGQVPRGARGPPRTDWEEKEDVEVLPRAPRRKRPRAAPGTDLDRRRPSPEASLKLEPRDRSSSPPSSPPPLERVPRRPPYHH